MVLVIIGAVTLVIGVFFADDDLTLVYVSIVSCLLAGVFLVVGIIRGRPSKAAPASPAPQPVGAPAGPSPGPAETPAWSSREPSAPAGQAGPAASRSGPAVAPVARRSAPPPTPAEDAAAEVSGEDRTAEMPGAGAPVVASAKDEPEQEPVAEPAAPPSKRLSLKKGLTKKSVARKAVAKKAAAKKAAAPAPEPAAPPAEEAPAVAEQPEAVVVPAEKATKKAAGKKATKKATARRDAPESFQAALTGVTGLGPARATTLHERFGSISALRGSSVEEIAATPGVSRTIAERILNQLGA